MNTLNDKCQLKFTNLQNSKLYALCSNPFALWFFLIFNFFFLIEATATIRYVSKTGTSTPPYTTWETAADSIMEAINISEFGDTIYVANGVYEEQVTMIPGLSLIGAGADSCIIDTRNLVTSQDFRSVTVTDSCLLTGFHIIVYNNPSWGRGIVTSEGNTISWIYNNKVTSGFNGFFEDQINTGHTEIIYQNIFSNVTRGIVVFNSNAIVKQNNIYIPNISGGRGIHIEAFDNNYSPVIDSNYIETFREGIYKSFGARPTISNNTIILRSEGARGIRIGSSDSTKVYNNLIIAENGRDGINNINIPYLQIYNNYATGNFDDQQNLAYVFTVGSNNIAKNNVVTNAERGVEVWGTENLIFQYNNVWNNNVNYSGFSPDTTNLSVNPMVVNNDTTQGELDFHLQMFSPLIDAGDPSMIDKDSSRIDIGLYGGLYGEVYKYLDLAPRPPANLTGEVDSGMITIKWNTNTEADFSNYKLFRDTVASFTADSSNFILSLKDTFYSHLSLPDIYKYYYKLTAVDNQSNESEVSEELFIKITSVNDFPYSVNNYMLYQNYPNPFNPSTKIGYRLKERGYVKLYVYSVTGELVSVLINQIQEAGYYEVEFDARYLMLDAELASGIYIYQIMIRNENDIPLYSGIKKMLLIK